MSFHKISSTPTLYMVTSSVLDCSKMQSPTEFIARKIVTSSANNKYLVCLITLQRSLIKILESKGPKTDLCGTPEKTGNEQVSECV